MEQQIEELTKRIEQLEKDRCEDGKGKVKKEKRKQSDKQKEIAERFKKAYAKYAPDLKKENPTMRQSEIFSLVHKKIKEEK